MSHLSPQEATNRLQAISADYWELLLRRNPVWATDLGDRRFDDRLPDLSLEARAEYYAGLHGLFQRLEAVPAGALTGQEAITHEVLRAVLETEIAGEPHLDDQFTINPLYGPVSWLTDIAERQPVVPRENLDKLIRRFEQSPRLFQQLEAQLRTGMTRGATAPLMGAERMARQIRRMLEIAPEESSFLPPAAVPDGIPPQEYEALRGELVGVVAKHVYPTLAAHADFLEKTYLPVARSKPGLCHMPGGESYYQYLIRLFTGSDLTAHQIHELGREELSRIHTEMVDIAEKTSGLRDIRAFVEVLRARPDQYLHDRQGLLEHNRRLLERASAALPGYFSLLPDRPCEIRAIEAFREADSPSGYYSHAPDDGSRPAYYYVNTYRPEQRPLFNMEALAFHEAVPGHHLQIAIAQDLEGLPEFRRHTGQTAYIEGWALYSERLSDEMGLYTSDFTRFGMLNYQAWRAARLVVDTGIHALGWTREQAIAELLENTAHTEHEASVEVDRYICMPGQALAYMLGRIEIGGLRSTAESVLGPRFDIKEFHKRVLENGAVPLASLKRIIHKWLDAEA